VLPYYRGLSDKRQWCFLLKGQQKFNCFSNPWERLVTCYEMGMILSTLLIARARYTAYRVCRPASKSTLEKQKDPLPNSKNTTAIQTSWQKCACKHALEFGHQTNCMQTRIFASDFRKRRFTESFPINTILNVVNKKPSDIFHKYNIQSSVWWNWLNTGLYTFTSFFSSVERKIFIALTLLLH